MNFKKICLALLAVVIVSCAPETVDPFDHAEQYVTEKPIIDEFLSTHYFDDVDNEIKEIDNGQTALIDDTNLQALPATLNEVEYTMYSYVYEQGTQEFPDADDAVFAAYRVTGLNGDLYQENYSSETNFSLNQVIEGWRTGLVVFKGGISDESNTETPREFKETGKGFMIIPSGLAYRNLGSGSIAPNQSLIFKVELRKVVSQGEDL